MDIKNGAHGNELPCYLRQGERPRISELQTVIRKRNVKK
jgi:hypothetical protein